MEKKLFIVELRFKLSWASCIFICSIWPRWMGLPSTPVGEGREVTSGKESGLFAWFLVSETPGRPGLWLQASLPGPWEKALGLFSELCLPGENRQGPAAAEGSLENNLETIQASPGSCQRIYKCARVPRPHHRPSPVGLRGRPDRPRPPGNIVTPSHTSADLVDGPACTDLSFRPNTGLPHILWG